MRDLNSLLRHYTYKQIQNFLYLLQRAESLNLGMDKIRSDLENNLLSFRKEIIKKDYKLRRSTHKRHVPSRILHGPKEKPKKRQQLQCVKCGSVAMVKPVNDSRSTHIEDEPELRSVLLCTSGNCKHAVFSTQYVSDWVTNG